MRDDNQVLDNRPGRKRSGLGLRTLVVLGLSLATAAIAATTTYQYDALGRLIQVTHNNGNVTAYNLDPAGNRTGVSDLLSQSSPAWISVPASSSGNYTVSWANGSFAKYELYESPNTSFSTTTRVYEGPSTSTAISGHAAGTYYYRVRGCAGSACTIFISSSNGVAVNPPPPAPTGLAKNQNSGCSWAATWTASTGATYYTIRDQSGNFQYNVNAPATSTTYSFCGAPGYTGFPNDYRPKWLKACNAQACSAQTNFP